MSMTMPLHLVDPRFEGRITDLAKYPPAGGVRSIKSLEEIKGDLCVRLALHDFKKLSENEFQRDEYRITIDCENDEVKLVYVYPEGSWNCPSQKTLYWGPMELADEYIRRFIPMKRQWRKCDE